MKGADELAALQGELASVARETARLLLDPEYDDEEELWSLDLRARELNARIQSVVRANGRPPSAPACPAPRGTAPTLSGG